MLQNRSICRRETDSFSSFCINDYNDYLNKYLICDIIIKD